MAKQSRDVTILLTRPAAQSFSFAQEVIRALGDVSVVISPLMAPNYLMPQIPYVDFAAVIFVSVAAIEAAKRIASAEVRLPQLAYCVGDRTAEAARLAGFQSISAGGDARDLLAMIVAQKPTGPLLFLRGRDSSGDIEGVLNSAKIETISAVCYEQIPQPFTDKAAKILHEMQPVIVPLFSGRSAVIFQTQLLDIAATAPVWAATLSPAITLVLNIKTIVRTQTADHPDGASMIVAMKALLMLGTAT